MLNQGPFYLDQYSFLIQGCVLQHYFDRLNSLWKETPNFTFILSYSICMLNLDLYQNTQSQTNPLRQCNLSIQYLSPILNFKCYEQRARTNLLWGYINEEKGNGKMLHRGTPKEGGKQVRNTTKTWRKLGKKNDNLAKKKFKQILNPKSALS